MSLGIILLTVYFGIGIPFCFWLGRKAWLSTLAEGRRIQQVQAASRRDLHYFWKGHKFTICCSGPKFSVETSASGALVYDRGELLVLRRPHFISFRLEPCYTSRRMFREDFMGRLRLLLQESRTTLCYENGSTQVLSTSKFWWLVKLKKVLVYQGPIPTPKPPFQGVYR